MWVQQQSREKKKTPNNGGPTHWQLLRCRFRERRCLSSQLVLIKPTPGFEQPNWPAWVVVFWTRNRYRFQKTELALYLLGTGQPSSLSWATVKSLMQLVCEAEQSVCGHELGLSYGLFFFFRITCNKVQQEQLAFFSWKMRQWLNTCLWVGTLEKRDFWGGLGDGVEVAAICMCVHSSLQ